MTDVILNQSLVSKQDVSTDKEQHIIELHKILNSVIKSMRTLDPENQRDLIELKESVKIVESLEYMLQCSWNFSVDKNYHSWWHRLPHCRCPNMDNNERQGTQYRVYNGECPLHSIIDNEEVILNNEVQ